MSNKDLWKYCTNQHCLDLLLSFQLFGDTNRPDNKQIAALYALSNNIEARYTATAIAKSDGTPRYLLVPDPLLKQVQKNILRNVLNPFPVSDYATAYKKGANLIANAQPHIGQKQLLKLDIENFFASISFSMVYRCAFPYLFFPPPVRTLLTELCCYRDGLPQGAPTSAAISNLVMKSFDEHIGQWCAGRGISYTRYCDDMTFSGEFDARKVKNKVNGFLSAMGFRLNDNKTKLLKRHHRQTVTGVMVNEKMQASAQYRKRLRQEIYYCKKYGVAEHLTRINAANCTSPDRRQVTTYLTALLGKIHFILQINPDDTEFQQARSDVQALITRHQ